MLTYSWPDKMNVLMTKLKSENNCVRVVTYPTRSIMYTIPLAWHEHSVASRARNTPQAGYGLSPHGLLALGWWYGWWVFFRHSMFYIKSLNISSPQHTIKINTLTLECMHTYAYITRTCTNTPKWVLSPTIKDNQMLSTTSIISYSYHYLPAQTDRQLTIQYNSSTTSQLMFEKLGSVVLGRRILSKNSPPPKPPTNHSQFRALEGGFGVGGGEKMKEWARKARTQ